MTVPRAFDLREHPGFDASWLRVFIDGDMPRGVIAWNADEGWAEVMVWNDDGTAVGGASDPQTRRVYGKVNVVEI